MALLPPESPEDAEDLAASAVDRVDGLLLAGGYDVDPAYYGEAPASGLGTVEPLRDTFEIALVRVFRRAGRPILGICRGAQVLNVALGGTLYQDIPGHNQSAPRPQATHPVFLAAESRLFRIVGGIRELAVNCVQKIPQKRTIRGSADRRGRTAKGRRRRARAPSNTRQRRANALETPLGTKTIRR
ncbi:MAG: gamma-glutamyl-gamma-aminobutyrate hydrolase family protein [Brockia lithotrophica]|nr:gamma-glutamyl-gamma-aminobutyrate hydrolase family protein [Brockia lithotrophica]